ncbi:hypothetical protein IFM89_007172 [Coptis chinensis]|uniref:Uncharacterized protein n=1 Tax=Coptis chinensis TaxID=261450 RepID=A0A835HCU6_9MAGN|nr:hypothetical protein IFM89_007172 [Coptis chinensis]
MAPPVARPTTRTVPRTFLKNKRRTRRRSLTGGNDDDLEDGFYGDGGSSGGDGLFGGGGGGGGRRGKGWNYDGCGGSEWEFSDPAFDFVYEMICWIVMSNCLHFALKKICRILFAADGEFVDSAREKGPLRLVSIY